MFQVDKKIIVSVLQRIAVVAAALVALAVVASSLSMIVPTDNSDVDYLNRSGMSIRTDALTGCQYLESTKGGLTPRMDSNSKQVGCKSLN